VFAVVALVVLVSTLMTPDAGNVVPNDTGIMHASMVNSDTGSAILHADASNVQTGPTPAVIHDDAGTVHRNFGAALIHDAAVRAHPDTRSVVPIAESSWEILYDAEGDAHLVHVRREAEEAWVTHYDAEGNPHVLHFELEQGADGATYCGVSE
jgi:hypothetical protein